MAGEPELTPLEQAAIMERNAKMHPNCQWAAMMLEAVAVIRSLVAAGATPPDDFGGMVD